MMRQRSRRAAMKTRLYWVHRSKIVLWKSPLGAACMCGECLAVARVVFQEGRCWQEHVSTQQPNSSRRRGGQPRASPALYSTLTTCCTVPVFCPASRKQAQQQGRQKARHGDSSRPGAGPHTLVVSPFAADCCRIFISCSHFAAAPPWGPTW